MDESLSRSFVYNAFRNYYTSSSFSVPSIPGFTQREFGIFDYRSKKMVRHLRFNTKKDLREFLGKSIPSDVYRSTAYYEYPEADMSQKEWIGADLVFDIDADHIISPCNKIHDKWICTSCNFEGKGITPDTCPICGNKKISIKSWPCETCLNYSKEETKKLLDFLLTDFGFASTEIHVFFSGHRGYHVHVETDTVKKLDTIARKEIVDYVTGLGVPLSNKKRKSSFPDTYLSNFGWQKRLKTGLISFLANTTKEDLKKIGIKRTSAVLLKNRDLILNRFIRDGRLRSVKGVSNKTWEKLILHVKNSSASQIDTVVTTDTHRLIRLNNTLHGKTGFRKIEFPIQSINTFDPFKEAIAFNDDIVKVLVSDAPLFRIGDKMYGPYKNQIVELSINAAILLICKDRAKLVNENV